LDQNTTSESGVTSQILDRSPLSGSPHFYITRGKMLFHLAGTTQARGDHKFSRKKKQRERSGVKWAAAIPRRHHFLTYQRFSQA